jgi:hypothetical protein
MDLLKVCQQLPAKANSCFMILPSRRSFAASPSTLQKPNKLRTPIKKRRIYSAYLLANKSNQKALGDLGFKLCKIKYPFILCQINYYEFSQAS